MSALLYAITLIAGYVYLEALCLLAVRKGKYFSMNDLSEDIRDVLNNQNLMKDFFQSVKDIYKKEK